MEKLRGFVSTMLLMFLGFYLTANIVFYSLEYYKRDSIVLTMIESAKVAGVTSIDGSSRVTPKQVKITEETFENTFETFFQRNLNVKMNVKDFSYHYLKDAAGNIKAVQVIVTDENGTEYQTTLREHIPNY